MNVILISIERNILPNTMGNTCLTCSELRFHLSVDHAYLGSNVRALVLLTFIGYVNKQQYLKIYSLKFHAILAEILFILQLSQ